MSRKYLSILLTLVFMFVSTIHCVYYDNGDDVTTTLSKKYIWKNFEYRDYIRCTRRFSPGTCPSAVRSVWTFVFQNQNCTERLGCPISSKRTNRYMSYATCMRRCQALMDVYTNILARDTRNITQYLRDHSWRNFGNSRRNEKEKDIEEDDEEYAVTDEADIIEEPDPDPRDDHGFRYRPIPDIDYVGGDVEGYIDSSNNK